MREKLVELLEEAEDVAHEALMRENYSYRDAMLIEADHLIANGVRVQKWIPVTERLPKATGKYLVCRVDTHGVTMIGTNFYFAPCLPDGVGGWSSEAVITHWMPLPEPPKEVQR